MKPTNVDDYIAQAPEELQERLQRLRSTIVAAAPGAEERISYGMPYYKYKGRLVYFQLWPKHIGIYALAKPVLEQYKSELEGYVMNKGSVRFPLDEELPIALIERLVEARVKRNDEDEKK